MAEDILLDQSETIEIHGARVHNLKNIDVSIPRDQLVVITGLSGSGKSSLAFDTIYAEGQRRYIETFSAYARQFLGSMERPDVDQITGLSPVIAIEQKTISKNPRSTVGTITEIYDFLRLLFARAGEAVSYVTGEKMIQYSEDQIIDLVTEKYHGKKIMMLSPVVKGRKGHYRELFEQILKMGFIRARIDGDIVDLTDRYKLDRYKTHDVEIVIDRLMIDAGKTDRVKQSIKTALKHGKGVLMILDTETNEAKHFSRNLMCPTSGISYDEPAPNMFSFNSPYGACKSCNGIGTVNKIDLKKIVPDDELSIYRGALTPLGEYKNNWVFKQLEAIAKKYECTLKTPFKEFPEELKRVILEGSSQSFEVQSSVGLNDYSIKFEGLLNFIERQTEENPSKAFQRWATGFMATELCETCKGARLNQASLHFKIDDKSIADFASLDLIELHSLLDNIETRLSERQLLIAGELLKEIKARLNFLLDVGLNYLTLNRSAKTLSGGEAQRIRLATQIGSQLVGVLYILDEPSIGLHQRDNERLIKSLQQLRDIGNSVLVVEHDKDMILAADYVLDIGPGAGMHGGEIITQGKPSELISSKSTTANYLTGVQEIKVPDVRRAGNGHTLSIKGCTGHNLKNVDVEFPLGKLICVTGVSGSGKSSLINQTLYPILSQYFYKSSKIPLSYKSIDGLKHLDKVIEIDQSPIGRTPRSNPATYTGVLTDIRSLYAQTVEAKIRGYKPGRFSFNTKGGRCEACQGAGLKTIEMNFMPDVYVLCEECNGRRFNRETIEIRYKSKSIADILAMTIEEAVVFFEAHPKIYRKLITLSEVGLGYITLGQQSTTLSGGEAQRVKLASELSKKDTGNTFYILDEPTTGLHFEDINLLVGVINKLVDSGNSVVIIEHNMDIIKVADYVIDIGPEGGSGGGEVVSIGTPEEIVSQNKGFTAPFLKNELASKTN
ncbi:MAG: excinuclease ABC subunit A [Flavobacteriales bacterium]|jgi:excinuclease ABC subunit A